GQQARHAARMRQEAEQADEEEDANRRSDIFNTADIEAHLRRTRGEERSTDNDRHDSVMVEVPDEQMLAVVAKLVVISQDQLAAYINLAPGTAFPRYLLEAVLDKAGVQFGRIEANIIKATQPSDAVRRLQVARGIDPKPGKPGMSVRGNETTPLLQSATVEISPDGLSATMHTAPDTPVDHEDLLCAVQEAGITAHLLPGILDRIARGEADADGCTVVARGEPPIHGVPSQFIPSRTDVLDQDDAQQYLANLDKAQEDDGEVRRVKRGECLAVWRPGTHPKDGRTVTGQAIPAQAAAHPSAASCAGEGTELHRNKKKFIYLRAKQDGAMQILEDGTVRVIGIQLGDSGSMQAGSVIEADDLLEIDGDIPDGVTVHANAGLIVHGDIHDAVVTTGGDCLVDGVIHPGGSTLQCAGELRCTGISERSLVVGSAVVDGPIIASTLTAVGNVRATIACGGTITAGGNIDLEEIGDERGTATEIWAGHSIPSAARRDMAVLEERKLRNEREHMLSERSDMREMVETIARTQYRFNVGGWMGKEYLLQLKDRIERIKLRGACIEESLERARTYIVDKVDEVEDLTQEADNTKAYVRAERVHTAVIVKLADSESRRFEHGQEALDYRMHE
ncbi:MAG: flagellar assembly protein A, partial [Planctomycetota bacterium]